LTKDLKYKNYSQQIKIEKTTFFWMRIYYWGSSNYKEKFKRLYNIWLQMIFIVKKRYTYNIRILLIQHCNIWIIITTIIDFAFYTYTWDILLCNMNIVHTYINADIFSLLSAFLFLQQKKFSSTLNVIILYIYHICTLWWLLSVFNFYLTTVSYSMVPILFIIPKPIQCCHKKSLCYIS